MLANHRCELKPGPADLPACVSVCHGPEGAAVSVRAPAAAPGRAAGRGAGDCRLEPRGAPAAAPHGARALREVRLPVRVDAAAR